VRGWMGWLFGLVRWGLDRWWCDCEAFGAWDGGEQTTTDCPPAQIPLGAS
jgi:hypothetical protein